MTQSRRHGAPRVVLVCAIVFSTVFTANHPAAAQELSRTSPQGKIAVRWTSESPDGNKVVVEVSGLSAGTLKTLEQARWTRIEWQRFLSVYATQGARIDAPINLPPMLGTYRIQSGKLRFEPQFPLEPGLHYNAILHPDQLPGGDKTVASIAATFELPPSPSKRTTVVRQIYPTAQILPENLLKFYVHFSAPMSGGGIYDYIRLRDASGTAVELPFLEIDEELWDPTMTRLTLFIDPGRIKRGVAPLEEIGPALEAGKRYTLVIDKAWKDGTGHALGEGFQKAFRVGPPDRDPPEPAQWKIQAPKSETREPLVITFPDPMDHALAQRMIRVADERGEALEGKTELQDEERRWSFAPARPWRRGPHDLIIQPTIEDLAGNNIGKAFEVDLVEPIQRRLSSQSVKLRFEVR